MGTPPISAIPSLYNTGVDADHNLLAACAGDSNYGMVVRDPSVWPIAGGPWVANPSNAQWISPSCDGNEPITSYSNSLTFTVPAGVELATLYGGCAVDNTLDDIIVNGVSTGPWNVDLNALYPITLSGFVSGTNTISFEWTNIHDNSPAGLLVCWTSADIGSSSSSSASGSSQSSQSSASSGSSNSTLASSSSGSSLGSGSSSGSSLSSRSSQSGSSSSSSCTPCLDLPVPAVSQINFASFVVTAPANVPIGIQLQLQVALDGEIEWFDVGEPVGASGVVLVKELKPLQPLRPLTGYWVRWVQVS